MTFNWANSTRWEIADVICRSGILGLALLAFGQAAETNAQTIPVMGYVAAKNANPKRLEAFKKGLADVGYIEGQKWNTSWQAA